MSRLTIRHPNAKKNTTILMFCALEQDTLLSANKSTPEIKRKLKALEFVIDELAIQMLEHDCKYAC